MWIMSSLALQKIRIYNPQQSQLIAAYHQLKGIEAQTQSRARSFYCHFLWTHPLTLQQRLERRLMQIIHG